MIASLADFSFVYSFKGYLLSNCNIVGTVLRVTVGEGRRFPLGVSSPVRGVSNQISVLVSVKFQLSSATKGDYL